MIRAKIEKNTVFRIWAKNTICGKALIRIRAKIEITHFWLGFGKNKGQIRIKHPLW